MTTHSWLGRLGSNTQTWVCILDFRRPDLTLRPQECGLLSLSLFCFSFLFCVPLQRLWKNLLCELIEPSHLFSFHPDTVLFVLSRTHFPRPDAALRAMCFYDCTQPRPPSALASVASECSALPRLACWEDMCSLKRWTRPPKKKRNNPHLAFCKAGQSLLAAGLLLCCIGWTELSTNEAAYHVCPERKPHHPSYVASQSTRSLLPPFHPLIRALVFECFKLPLTPLTFNFLPFFRVSLLIASVCSWKPAVLTESCHQNTNFQDFTN